MLPQNALLSLIALKDCITWIDRYRSVAGPASRFFTHLGRKAAVPRRQCNSAKSGEFFCFTSASPSNFQNFASISESHTYTHEQNRGVQYKKKVTNEVSTLVRKQPVVTLGEFVGSATCYAGSTVCSGQKQTSWFAFARETLLQWRNSESNHQVSIPYRVDAWIRRYDWGSYSDHNHLWRWACPWNGNLVRVTVCLVHRHSSRDSRRAHLRLAACFLVPEAAANALVAVRNNWLPLCHTCLGGACQPFASVRWAQSGLYDSLNYLGSGLAGGLAYWRICQKVGIRSSNDDMAGQSSRPA